MAKIPFNIKFRDKIESGEYRVETKTGCPVRIVCWDMVCELPILGLVLLNDEKAEEMAVGFTNEGTNLLGEPLYDKLFIVTPEEELTPLEDLLSTYLKNDFEYFSTKKWDEKKWNETMRIQAAELLSLAREQFIKDGYVIEKKAFHDAEESISDKNWAAMSVEYSLHCKIENGTRHAIMDWEAFKRVAQKFINIGKAEALNDLPRWSKNAFSRGCAAIDISGLTVADYIRREGKLLNISALEKLPGFKEDEK